MAAPQNNFSGHSTANFCATHQQLPQCLQFQEGAQTQGATHNQGDPGQTGTQSQTGMQSQNGGQGQNGMQNPNGMQDENGMQNQFGMGGHNGDRNGGFGRRPSDYAGNGGSGLSFNFSSGDRDQFHQRFRGFNFGSFGTPTFSISIGGHVPHTYGLKHVPRSIYAYYPQFRGYLFFVGRRGDLVIVSPNNYRIVAVT
jgi:hypothetical protein